MTSTNPNGNNPLAKHHPPKDEAPRALSQGRPPCRPAPHSSRILNARRPSQRKATLEALEPRRLLTVDFRQFALPAGLITYNIAPAADGSVWIEGADYPLESHIGKSEILRFDPTTDQISYVFDMPSDWHTSDLLEGPDGNIWAVAQTTEGTTEITRFVNGGTITDSLPFVLSDYAFGSDHDLYASTQFTDAEGLTHGEIVRFNPTTDTITTFPLADTSSAPTNLTLGPDGNLWFEEGDQSEIGNITPDGMVTVMPIPSAIGNLDHAWLHPGAGQAVYFATTNTGLVYTIGVDGQATLDSPMTGLGPLAVAAETDGTAWFGAGGGLNEGGNAPQIVREGLGYIAADGSVQVYDSGLDSRAFERVDNSLGSDGEGGCWFIGYDGSGSAGLGENVASIIHATVADPSVSNPINLTPSFRWGPAYNGGGALRDGTLLASFTTTDPNATESDFVAFADDNAVTVESLGDGTFEVLSSGDLNTRDRLHTITVSVADIHNPLAISGASLNIAIGTLTKPYLGDVTVEVGHSYQNPAYSSSPDFIPTLGAVQDSVILDNHLPGIIVDWGDGTISPGSVAGDSLDGEKTIGFNHAYAATGTYTVKVVVFDGDAATASTRLVTVIDSPTIYKNGSGFFIPPLGLPYNGPVQSFAAIETDAVPSDFAAEINWGDGTSSPGTIVARDGQFDVYGSHTYASSTDAYIEGYITVTGVKTPSDQLIIPIAVEPKDPAIDFVTATNITATAGQEFQSSLASFLIDPAPSNLGAVSATIDYGDGIILPVQVQPDSGGSYYAAFNVMGDHIYATPGDKTITITIKSPYGSQDPVVVTGEVSVSAGAADDQPGRHEALQGQEADVVVGEFWSADPGASASAYSGLIDWQDGTTSPAVITPGPSTGEFLIEGTHTFHQVGDVSVSAEIMRAADGVPIEALARVVTVDSASITAAGRSLTVSAGGALSGAVVATFRSDDDGAPASAFQASIDWGDGSTSAGTIRPDPASGFAVVGSHAYARGGIFNPKVSISPGDVATTATSTVSVAYPPLPVSPVAVSATAGKAFDGTIATFVPGDASADPSAFTAEIDWGDGTSAAPGRVVAGPGGTLAVAGTHAYAKSGSYAITAVIARAGAAASLSRTATKVTATVADPAPAAPSTPPATTPPATTPVVVTAPPTTMTGPVSTPIGGETPPAAQTISDPPVTVEGVQVVKKKGVIVGVVVQFSGAMDAVTADDLADYGLASGVLKKRVMTYNHAVVLKSASYDPASHRVTLSLKKNLAASTRLRLTVKNPGSAGGESVLAVGSATVVAKSVARGPMALNRKVASARR